MIFLAASDIQAIVDWILGHLGPIFIAVVFFVLPILRGIKEQAAKKKALEARGVPPPASEDEERSGSEAWKALMRGEVREAPPPKVEPPPLARSLPPPVMRPVEGSETQPVLTGRLSDFADAQSEDEAESTLDEEGLAREMNDRLLREERLRRSDFLAREKESAARKTVAPDGSLVSIEAIETVNAAVVDRTARTMLLGTGTDRRAALRRALVAREVLGPPVALRRHQDALGPTALSP